jgi:thioredoxin-related protein
MVRFDQGLVVPKERNPTVAARAYLFWLLLAMFSGALFAETAPSQIKWAPDLATAKQASAQFKVPLMVHFYGDGCIPCRTLEKNVFTNPEVVQVLNKFFICVSINGTRDSKTMSEFNVHSYPTDVFLSPAGENLHQAVSPQDVRNYLGTLERVAVMNRDRNIAARAKTDNSNSNIAQQAMTTAGQLVSASNSGSTLPTLPPPGFNNQPGSARSGFYQSEGAQASQQQLQLGASSSSIVQSGPLLGSQQPTSITGSTPQPQIQAGMPTLNPQKSSTELGGLPFPPLTGQNSSKGSIPQLSRETTAKMGAYAQVATTAGPQTPTVPNQAFDSNVLPLKVNSGLAQWNSGVSKVSSTLENPHFPGNQSPDITATSISTQKTGPATNGNINRLASAQISTEQAAVIDGYCPVSLRAKKWIKGDPQYAVKHRGMLFYLADEACADEFLNKPDFYSPVLLGNDPMVLLIHGRLEPGSTQHGLFEDKVGPLFFSSAESKAEFHRNFENNMRAIETILQRAASR